MDLWETDKAHIYREEERETEWINILVQSLPLFSQRKRENKKKEDYLFNLVKIKSCEDYI